MKDPIHPELDRYTAFVRGVFESLHAGGYGQPFHIDEPSVHPDGRRVAVSATVLDKLGGHGRSELWIFDLAVGARRRLSQGLANDSSPQWSPCGRWLGFLTDRADGISRLALLAADGPAGDANVARQIPGSVEYFRFSPSGARVLLGIADLGADQAGMQGAKTVAAVTQELASWMPRSSSGANDTAWRWLGWLPAIAATHQAALTRCSPVEVNTWEATWLGEDSVAAVASDSPVEGAWYQARLERFGLRGEPLGVLARPSDQAGALSGSPDGKRLAWVHGIASDRWVVAGRVHVIDVDTGADTVLDSQYTDVSQLAWRDSNRLVFAGHREFETVIGEFDVAAARSTVALASRQLHAGFWMPCAQPLGDTGFLAITQAFAESSAITVIEHGLAKVVAALPHPSGSAVKRLVGQVHELRWIAPDGLEIQGWLVAPRTSGPYPIATEIHGGPVWMNRNSWLGNMPLLLGFLAAGYAVFLPNPRGSWGRGQDFVRPIVGDMGGADTADYLSGFDHLVKSGLADPRRLCLTGSSYGGFMSSWLVTQDNRFAASAPRCPVTDWNVQHRLSNIAHFDDQFLAGSALEPGGLHHRRSPITNARRVKTPTLILAGALDKCTPPAQARSFYRALAETGVESALVIYPEEGHGLRRYEVRIDVTARILAWFDRHGGVGIPEQAKT